MEMNQFFTRVKKTLPGKKNTLRPEARSGPGLAAGPPRGPPKVDLKMSPDRFKRNGFLTILIILGVPFWGPAGSRPAQPMK